jgi:hypothetical protein
MPDEDSSFVGPHFAPSSICLDSPVNGADWLGIAQFLWSRWHKLIVERNDFLESIPHDSLETRQAPLVSSRRQR